MTHNEELQTTIEEALLWEPTLHATHIRVQVADGIVTLSGTVDLYSKKAEAERVVKALHGVKALIEKIEVCHPDEWTPQADSVIAHRAVQSLEWNWKLPKDSIRVVVEHGWITLEGEVQWNFEKEEALNTLLHLEGVVGITDHIEINSSGVITADQECIAQALRKSWALHACDILVAVHGSLVTLIGTVHSLYQKEEAGRIAWKTPGVEKLENKLVVKNVIHYAL